MSKNSVSAVGLKITGGPDWTDVKKCIEQWKERGNRGLVFNLQKVAYDPSARNIAEMVDPADSTKFITGEVTIIVQRDIPIGYREHQGVLMGHLVKPLTLNGQPLPLADDNGQDLATLKRDDATSSLTSGVPVGSYVELTYDGDAHAGEIRYFIQRPSGDMVTLLSLKDILGMDHKGLPPIPPACQKTIEDKPI